MSPLRHPIHPWPVRLAHWLNLLAMTGMFMSGWEIYNASPLFNFRFPGAITLGGWLGGAIGWHLAMMWLWVGNGFVYMMWSLISGHWRRRWLPLSLRVLWHDIHQTLTLNLRHTSHQYNAIQKVMYFGVMVLGILMALSGLAIWKPVQLFWLTNLFGGFATARYVHFLVMSGIALFVAIHVLMVLIVPRTLWAMLTGGKHE